MYSNVEVIQTGYLPVGGRHELYWETCGNPEGKPVIFLHGGPGGWAPPEVRGFFDPARYHIIIFDQRGCGRSRPYGCIEENTTWDLVADMERLRTHLGIECWQVFGGSWGSTLALAYAQTHPERVTELVLRGIFLCRPSEIAWLSEAGGASQVFPEAWEDYLAPIAEARHDALVEAYGDLLLDDTVDSATRLAAAQAWAQWENHVVRLQPTPESLAEYEDAKTALAIARIECHYFLNEGWLTGERALLANIDRIRHIPTVIVQGRYDMCTPMRSAWDLHRAFPEAVLQIVHAGHSGFEPEIAQALVAATDQFAAA